MKTTLAEIIKFNNVFAGWDWVANVWRVQVFYNGSVINLEPRKRFSSKSDCWDYINEVLAPIIADIRSN